MAAGVRQGDAVITVPNTFIATVEAITMVGATPIFVDIDKQTYHLSPFLLEEYLENNTRLGIGGHRIDGKTGKTIIAVLPVHLFGMMVDMKPILEIAAKYNLVVVEDCAQAHGANYTLDGTTYKAGTLGVTAGFSFYPGKNLSALGEGGAVTTNDINVANFMRMLRDHGSNQKYIHTTPDGWNSRLDALQCAFLDIKLKNLDEWNLKRREAANLYQKFLKGFDQIIIPFVPEGREHVYHLFVVRVKNPDEVMKSLAESGISCGLHYPVPLHLQVAYRDLGYTKGDFPESETAAAELISLPMFPHIN
jgi:dTDP-4-amino-4,6-dideoxygalactose transaminase